MVFFFGGELEGLDGMNLIFWIQFLFVSGNAILSFQKGGLFSSSS